MIKKFAAISMALVLTAGIAAGHAARNKRIRRRLKPLTKAVSPQSPDMFRRN
ncbi:hypothetical protein LJK87_47890 [Paenibacillus sp. P25]|nr:hypothetical protein LJK87_47890 [Paenibacillus sp. P25]